VPIKPSLNAYLLCDQVLRDQHGRCSLVGVFQHLKSPVFPLPPRSFSVFVSLAEVVVPSRLELLFKDVRHGRLLQEVTVDCTTPVTPNQPYEINADFANVAFETPGDYDFELRADGQLLAIRTLTITRVTEPGA
jgi:hypothetical protein